MNRITRAVSLLIAALLLCVGLSACEAPWTHHYATPDSDTYVCVYEGGKNSSHKLKEGYPLQPNTVRKEIGKDDIVVYITAADRYWANVRDDSTRDPGAKYYFQHFTLGSGVQAQVESTTEFMVGPKNPCGLYDVRLRRNLQDKDTKRPNLEYDARVGPDYTYAQVKATPWFLFLKQFVEQQIDKAYRQEMRKYSWESLYFDYPINADENGNVPKGEKPGISTQDQLAKDVGRIAQQRLADKLGDDYLCGLGARDGEECPPFEITINDVTLPEKYASLVSDRAEVEKLNAAGRSADARLAALTALDTANTKSAEVEKRTQAAELERAKADADLAIAKYRAAHPECVIHAEVGLDCKGNFPPANAGVGITVTPPASSGG